MKSERPAASSLSRVTNPIAIASEEEEEKEGWKQRRGRDECELQSMKDIWRGAARANADECRMGQSRAAGRLPSICQSVPRHPAAGAFAAGCRKRRHSKPRRATRPAYLVNPDLAVIT